MVGCSRAARIIIANLTTKVTESEHRAIFRSRVFNEEDFDNIRQSLYVKHVATENILTAIIALANDGKLDPPLQEVIIRDRQDLMQSVRFCTSGTHGLLDALLTTRSEHFP